VLLIFVGKGFFLLVPLGGAMVGGIVVVLAGIVKTRCVPRPKQEDKDTATKA
jgi:phosphatidylserine decarboxylase